MSINYKAVRKSKNSKSSSVFALQVVSAYSCMLLTYPLENFDAYTVCKCWIWSDLIKYIIHNNQSIFDFSILFCATTVHSHIQQYTIHNIQMQNQHYPWNDNTGNKEGTIKSCCQKPQKLTNIETTPIQNSLFFFAFCCCIVSSYVDTFFLLVVYCFSLSFYLLHCIWLCMLFLDSLVLYYCVNFCHRFNQII